jgi:hypothetical protein
MAKIAAIIAVGSSDRRTPMTSPIEAQEVLQAVVAGIPDMADYIAAVPERQKPIALDAVERHYLVTAQNLGCADEPARLWVSAVMLQIRDQIEQIAERVSEIFPKSFSFGRQRRFPADQLTESRIEDGPHNPPKRNRSCCIVLCGCHCAVRRFWSRTCGRKQFWRSVS